MKAKNLLRAVLYALVPALGRRYQMRNEAWRNHVNEMQRALDSVHRIRADFDSRNDSRKYCTVFDGVPAYPEICR